MDPQAEILKCARRIMKETTGLKGLVLCEETAGILGVIQSYSQLLQEEVCYVENLKNRTKRSEKLLHLHAVIFVRPTEQNIQMICKELQEPRFRDYVLIFSNILRRPYIEQLAEADLKEVVNGVHEAFADYYAIRSRLVVMGNPDAVTMDRSLDGLFSLLVSLRKRTTIRYQASSQACRHVAERITVKMDQESSLFEDHSGAGAAGSNPMYASTAALSARSQQASGPSSVSSSFHSSGALLGSQHRAAPLLLILDRFEDPVTPLLNQWTYEAMLHELLGIQNNRVSLRDTPGVKPDFEEVVLEPTGDEFFSHNMFSNFGDLGIHLKELVDRFSEKSKSAGRNIQDIDSMLKFVEEFPEFRRASSNVSKHVLIASELSRLVDQCQLLRVSQTEQDLACRESETEHRKQMLALIADPKVSLKDKVRLALLFVMRYELSPTCNVSQIKDALRVSGAESSQIDLINEIRRYSGSARRKSDVFSNRSFFAKAANTVRRGIGGVDNVYTQHEPLLASVLDSALRGRLSSSEFPVIVENGQHVHSQHQHPYGYGGSDSILSGSGSTAGGGGGGGGGSGSVGGIATASGGGGGSVDAALVIPREIIVFYVGGCTYEEYKTVSAINGEVPYSMPDGSSTMLALAAARQNKAKVVLSSSCMLNSAAFLRNVNRPGWNG